MTVVLLKRFKHALAPATLRWVVRAMGIVLIGIGLWSGVELGRYLLHPRTPMVASACGWAGDCNASNGRSLLVRSDSQS